MEHDRTKHDASLIALIDGGGTQTRLRLIDRATGLTAEGFSGPSSLTLGVENAWVNITKALESAAHILGQSIKASDKIALYAGLAGGRNADMRAQYRAKAPGFVGHAEVVTDGYAALLGAFGGAPGIVLSVGTGVTAYALHSDGTVIDVSGHGFPVGDEGGGAWLGCRALQAYLKSLDGRIKQPSAIFDLLRQQFGQDIMAIHAWLRDARATEFASLAPHICTCYAQGDPFARKLVDEGLAELILAVDTVEDPMARLPIALAGGLSELYFSPLNTHFDTRLSVAKGKALDGLAVLAFGSAEGFSTLSKSAQSS